MSDMLYKLYIMMDEEADIRLQAREEAAALKRQRAELEKLRRARPAERELSYALEEAAEVLDGKLEELQTMELFRIALILGLELGRLIPGTKDAEGRPSL